MDDGFKYLGKVGFGAELVNLIQPLKGDFSWNLI